MNHTSLSALLALALAASCASPQRPNGSAQPIDFAAEVQAYPAGIIPSIQARKSVGEKDQFYARVAANITDRQDFGEHDDETGEGFGVGLGWRHFLTPWTEATETVPGYRPDGWQYGVRLDVFDLSIDWIDPGNRRGTTDIIVVQPSIEFGYGWSNTSMGRLEANLGLGAEINVDTDGEDVGEGAILLFGLTWHP
jgi:hypothetical protein